MEQRGSACAGCTMDTGILRDIFHAYLEGNKILGKKASQEDWVRETLDKLPLYKIEIRSAVGMERRL